MFDGLDGKILPHYERPFLRAAHQTKRFSLRILITLICVIVLLGMTVPFVAYAEEAAVEVSADGATAKIEGSGFALADFGRAQVGSNRPIDDEYFGYLYYASDHADNLVAVAGESFVVVYVPAQAAHTVGFDINDDANREALKQLLIALDDKSAQGSARLALIDSWDFTDETEYDRDGVVYRFDQELRTEEYYTCVIGEDGSDITDPQNPDHAKPSFTDFARLVDASEATVVAEKEGWEAFTAFLSDIDYGPLWVTLKTTGTAIIFIFILGLVAAYFSLRIPPRAQDIADSIFTIPMVLPPTVCGFLLLLAFGRNTALGQWFIDVGFPLVFSWQATVLAAVVVAFPLMYRSARGAFEGLDSNMLDAARTLGWSNGKIFFRLMLPLSWSSIAAGTVLAFARALGEFGATLFLAGNYAGITRTIPIAIYFEWMNGNTDVAIFWTVIIIIISFIVILFINLWSRRTTKYRRRAKE